jgi:hypothetical protein
MRISSIIRSRSGVVLSSVIGTSCLSTEKASIVRQVRQFAKCATSGTMRNISNQRHCRASGFVLEPKLTFSATFANVGYAG